MKTRMISRYIVFTLCIFVSIPNIQAQDWPQFLGPDRNSTSQQKNLLRSWPEGGPEVLWTVDVGIGFGGPVARDNKVYLLDRDDEVVDKMRCFDLSTGKELWNYEYESPGSVMFPGSRSVPTLDGDHIYSCGHNGELYCFDINTHKPVWKKNVWTDFGGKANTGTRSREPGGFPQWAISQCPLVYDDMIIIASQAPEAGVVAYDKLTGAVRWKTPSLGDVGYVSPAIVKIDGSDHVVMVTASSGGRGGTPIIPGKIVGIDPISGELLWEYAEWVCHIPVPSAVDAGENRVLVVGGYELGAVMIKITKGADGHYFTTELFKTEEFGDQTKPPILHEGHFYAQYRTNNKRDGLSCMNMDGEIIWKTKRDPNFDRGSMILADGLILASDGVRMIYLIEPDPNGFKPLASAEILAKTEVEDERMASRWPDQNWAPIALVDGKLLIRDMGRMLCVRVAK